MYWLFIYMMTTNGIFHFVEFMTLLKKNVMQATTFAQDLVFFVFLCYLLSFEILAKEIKGFVGVSHLSPAIENVEER